MDIKGKMCAILLTEIIVGLYLASLNLVYCNSDIQEVFTEINFTLPKQVHDKIIDGYHHTARQNGMSGNKCPHICECSFSPEPIPEKLKLTCKPPYNPHIMAQFFQYCEGIKYLEYQSSGLELVPKELCYMKSLQMLDLKYNAIVSLENGPFSCFQNLSQLDISYNTIKFLHKDSFKGLDFIKIIIIENSGVHDLDKYTFLSSHLRNLELVDLSYNNLTYIDMWPFWIPSVFHHKQVIVNFTSNQIYKAVNTLGVQITDVNTSDILLVDFRRNQIKHVRNINFIKLLNITHWRELLRVWNMGFLFQFNPYDCDCDMYEFVKFLRPLIRFFKVMGDLSLIQLHCASPPSTKGMLIYKVPDYAFRCDVQKECPSPCSCTNHPGNTTMIVNCEKSNFRTLPRRVPKQNVLVLKFKGNNISTLSPQPYFKNVSTLDIGYSNVQTIKNSTFQELNNLQYLHLDGNLIKRLPDSFLDANLTSLHKITISENPFVCDCFILKTKRWIQQHIKQVDDTKGVVCVHGHGIGHQLVNVDDSLLMCGPDVPLILEIYVGVLLGLSALCIAYSYYRRTIQMMLFNTWKTKLSFSAVINTYKTYAIDILVVSIDANDEEADDAVENTVNKIKEQFPQIKMRSCEDVVLGKNALKAFSLWINSAKYLLLLVNKKFVQSRGDGTLLFQMAFDAWIEDKGVCMLMMLMDDENYICGQKEIDPELKAFIRKYPSSSLDQIITVLQTNLLAQEA